MNTILSLSLVLMFVTSPVSARTGMGPTAGTAPGTGTTGTPGRPALSPSHPQTGVLGVPSRANPKRPVPSSNRITTPQGTGGTIYSPPPLNAP